MINKTVKSSNVFLYLFVKKAPLGALYLAPMRSTESFLLLKTTSHKQHCARLLLLSSYIDISHLYKTFLNVNIRKILNKNT